MGLKSIKTWAAGLLSGLVLLCVTTAACAAGASAAEDFPLVIGGRDVHIFRAPIGTFSAAERAEGARKRIERAFAKPGEGWTSVKPTALGVEVRLDDEVLFLVVPGDVHAEAGESAEDLANRASRALQKAWSEARERNDPRARLEGLLKLALATALLLLALVATLKLSARLRQLLVARLHRRLESLPANHWGQRMSGALPGIAARLAILMTWLLVMAMAYSYLTYALAQFALTRPASETMSGSIVSLTTQALAAVVESLPGIFVAVAIFLLAWVATRISSEFFDSIEARPSDSAMLNNHTAPATRRIVNASLWLFAVAMAYPYLPGSHTEAFKGLSVIVGIMVSIGASGVVGQIASGVMIVYTYALKKGEYVRIQDYEGTVTELGLFVTRLRTGMGEEISLPNAFVLGNVTRNFSRVDGDRGYVLDCKLTIGYDTPWRQVHALLLEAAAAIPEIRKTPAAYVVQTALSDFYVEYKLVVYVDTDVPATRARVASDLLAAIQDAFNRHGVQIMSPHYVLDPQAPKIVAEKDWRPPPATPGPDV
ncbi:MAG: mechanosensitive ion channel [Rhodocyclales bacterium]|nr:mechanosensitive ion channel [Rhodocyclales bacterium]